MADYGITAMGKMEAELLAELDHDTGVGITLVSHVHHMGIT